MWKCNTWKNKEHKIKWQTTSTLSEPYNSLLFPFQHIKCFNWSRTHTHTPTHTNTHTRSFHHSFSLLTLTEALCLYILVILTKILTFISQMHVKGSQRIKFRWRMGSQRAANEIWTAEPRLRDLREGSVVRRTPSAHAGWFTQTRTHILYMKESIDEHTFKHLYIYTHKRICICTWTHTCMHTLW